MTPEILKTFDCGCKVIWKERRSLHINCYAHELLSVYELPKGFKLR